LLEELLSSEQSMCRRHSADDFDCCPSDIGDKEMSTLSWQLSANMSTRLNVDMSIIVHNMTRLFSSLTQLSCYDFVAKEREKKLKFTAAEWFTALEFYLQMDGKIHSLQLNIQQNLFHSSGSVLHENMFISRCSTSIYQ
jgi:hypothetical protein